MTGLQAAAPTAEPLSLPGSSSDGDKEESSIGSGRGSEKKLIIPVFNLSSFLTQGRNYQKSYLSFFKYLVCARPFIYTISFQPHKREVFIVSILEKETVKFRLSHLSKSPWLGNKGTVVQTYVCLILEGPYWLDRTWLQ